MRRAVLLAVLGALAIAGCGGEKGASTGVTTTGGNSVGPQRITMKDLEFAPESLKGNVDRPIRFENRDTISHNVVAKSGASFRSPSLRSGGTFDFTPKKTGRIDYVCTFHPGMEGSIDVRGAG